MIICNAVFPQLFWFKKAADPRADAVRGLDASINIGMWFERYVIIITGLSREYNPAVWGLYTPRWPELLILAGSFGFFATLFLIFIKIFPVIAITEVKELAIHEKPRPRGGALMPTLVGVFDQPAPVGEVARRLKGRGFEKLEIYSPAAFPELDDALDEKPSRVRLLHADRRPARRDDRLRHPDLDVAGLADRDRREALRVDRALHDHRLRAHHPVRRPRDAARPADRRQAALRELRQERPRLQPALLGRGVRAAWCRAPNATWRRWTP